MGSITCHYCQHEQNINKYDIETQVTNGKKRRSVQQTNTAISKDFRHLYSTSNQYEENQTIGPIKTLTQGEETIRNFDEVKSEVQKEFEIYNSKLINEKERNSPPKLINEEEINNEQPSKSINNNTIRNINALMLKMSSYANSQLTENAHSNESKKFSAKENKLGYNVEDIKNDFFSGTAGNFTDRGVYNDNRLSEEKSENKEDLVITVFAKKKYYKKKSKKKDDKYTTEQSGTVTGNSEVSNSVSIDAKDSKENISSMKVLQMVKTKLNTSNPHSEDVEKTEKETKDVLKDLNKEESISKSTNNSISKPSKKKVIKKKKENPSSNVETIEKNKKNEKSNDIKVINEDLKVTGKIHTEENLTSKAKVFLVDKKKSNKNQIQVLQAIKTLNESAKNLKFVNGPKKPSSKGMPNLKEEYEKSEKK